MGTCRGITPIKRDHGWVMRWRHEGAWQHWVDVEEDHARRLSEFLRALDNKILDTDPRITGRVYLQGTSDTTLAPMPAQVTLKAAVQLYSKIHEEAKKRAECRMQTFNRHFADWMDKPISSLPASAVTRMHHDLLDRVEGLTARRLERDTMATYMGHVVSVLRWAYRTKGWLAEDITTPRTLDFRYGMSKSQKKALEKHVFPQVLALASDETTELFLRLGVETGMRISEILALAVEDLLVDRGLIFVRHRMLKNVRLEGTKGTTRKTEPKTRFIPVRPELMARLVAWVAGRASTAPLLPNLSGGFYDPDLFRKTFWAPLKAAVVAAGVVTNMPASKFTPHILRHTFGTWMGYIVHPKVLQELMGHADLRMAMTYCHANDEVMRQGLDALLEIHAMK